MNIPSPKERSAIYAALIEQAAQPLGLQRLPSPHGISGSGCRSRVTAHDPAELKA